MKKITLLFLSFLTLSFGYAQVNLEDFEGTVPTFNIFEGLSSGDIVSDPVNSANNALRLVTSASGQPWQGAEMFFTTNRIKLTTDKTASVKIYATEAFQILAKVEQGQSGAPNSATSAAHGGTGWETLTFNFADSKDGTAAANGDYGKITFFPASWNGTAFGTVVVRTIYIDDIVGIQGSSIGTDPVPTTSAPTPPLRAVADVYSLFSNSYTNQTIGTWNAAWDSATSSDVLIDGNDTKKIVGLGFLGVEFLSNRINASEYTHLHIDIWTETPTLDKSFNLKLSNWAGGSSEANATEFSTTNASTPTLTNPNPGTWISLDIPFTSWTSGARDDIAQFIITSNLGIVYFDNLYLHKNTTLSTKAIEITGLQVYPNPTQDLWVIKTKSVKISSIELYDIVGKNVFSVSPNLSEAVVDASNLNSGMYFAKINTENGYSTLKLVKQ